MRISFKTISSILGSLLANSLLGESQEGRAQISASALYWYTSEAVDWAYTREYGANFEKASYQSFTFDGQPGFRVGLGYIGEDDCFSTALRYTWFHASAKAHASGDVTSAFLGARLSLLEPFKKGSAKLNLYYNIFDWDLSRNFQICDNLTLTPLIGLKGGWINQTIRSEWATPKELELFNLTATENLKHHFSGAGPKVGVGGTWRMTSIQEQPIHIIGTFEAGYLWGYWSIKDQYEDNLSTVIDIKPTDRNFGAFMLHAFIGVGTDCYLGCDALHLNLQFGYEIEDWFNHFQIFSNTSGTQNNPLVLQGLTFSADLDF